MIPLSTHLVAQVSAILLSLTMAFMVVKEGEPIPAFTAKTTEGNSFNSEKQLAGKPAILAFWRTKQMFAEKLLKDLQTLHDEFGREGIQIVAVCSGFESASEVAAMKKDFKLDFPVLLDPDKKVYAAFGVIVSPSTAFVDKDGKLDYYYASYRPDFLYVARANAQLLLGKIDRAQRDDLIEPKESSTDSTFNPAEPRFNLGMRFLQSGDWAAARRELLTAWEDAEFMVPAGVELGYLSLQTGKDREAIEFLSKVLEKAPDNMRATGGMGIAYLRVGRASEGKELVERALTAGLQEPFAFRELGLWYEKNGSRDEALAQFKAGLDAALQQAAPR